MNDTLGEPDILGLDRTGMVEVDMGTAERVVGVGGADTDRVVIVVGYETFDARLSWVIGHHSKRSGERRGSNSP